MARLGLLCLLLILTGCGEGGFGSGPRPTPTPEPPPAPGCPEIADCADVECGLDPVCGTDCGGCPDGDCFWGTCCVPETCESLGAECGAEVSDGCGGTLSCGGCSQGMVCDDDLSCACQELTAGDELSIGVPTVRLEFEITLAGDPLTAANTTADDVGVFLLKPEPPHAIGWEWVTRTPWDFDSEAPLDRVAFTVVPGRYDLYYSARGYDFDSAWPRNGAARLIGGVEALQDTTVAVDVPTARVQLDLSCRGEPLGSYAAEVPPGSAAKLTASGPGSVDLAILTDDPVLPSALTLLPGQYDLHWFNSTGVTEPLLDPLGRGLPLGGGANLGTAEVDDGGTLAFDLPVADAVVDFRLDGQVAVAPDPSDGATLQLDPEVENPDSPDGGPGQSGPGEPIDQVHIPLHAAEFPLLLPVTPGRYSFRYLNAGAVADAPAPAPSVWPYNRWPLALNEPVDDGWGRTWYLDTVEVQVGASLNGTPLDTTNTSVDDVGGIGLAARTKDAVAAISWLPQLWDVDGPTESTVRLVAGAYDVFYSSFSRQGMDHWPTALAPFPLEGNRLVTAPGSVSWSVPSQEVPLALTMRGGPLPPSAAAEGETPVLELSAVAAPNANDPTLLGWLRQVHARIDLADPPDVVILPAGEYSATYRPRGEPPGGAWGDAAETLFGGGGVDLVSAPLAVDLDYVSGRLTAALNGEDAVAANSSPGDHARFFITRGEPRATIGFLAFDTEAPDGRMSEAVNLPRGNWFIQYYPSPEQHDPWDGAPELSDWPVVPGVLWGCFDVR